jgi:hypothetical protein
LIALDAPFDRRRDPAHPLKIGRAAMPLAPSIDLLARSTTARLLFAWPERAANESWKLHVDAVASPSELADAAARWIECHPRHWAGWPYLRWRESSVSMRRNVSRLARPIPGRRPPSEGLDRHSRE